MAQDSDWISRYRQQITAWLNALNALGALGEQYVALDYGNSLTDEDFGGDNSDIGKADLVAAVASVQAIDAFTAQGHATNLYRLVK